MSEFLSLPVLAVLAAAFVNGATDAVNAAASCCASGALSPRLAAALAAVGDGVGALAFCALSAPVADTVTGFAAFGEQAPTAVLAAASAIAVWGAAAWAAGLPTSESHGMAAALCGAGFALCGGFAPGAGASWIKLCAGLLLSTAPTFALSRALARRKSAASAGKRSLFAFAAAMALLHGAQSGQKFAALVVTASAGAVGFRPNAVAAAALALAAGTALCGGRLIRRVGADVKLAQGGAFAADAVSALALLAATAAGLPVSTSQIRACALAGAGRADRRRAVAVAASWLATFPACAALGYAFAALA